MIIFYANSLVRKGLQPSGITLSYTRMHILNSIRAATESQCKSISILSHVHVDADRKQDGRLRSKLVVVVRGWTVAIQKVWH